MQDSDVVVMDFVLLQIFEIRLRNLRDTVLAGEGKEWQKVNEPLSFQILFLNAITIANIILAEEEEGPSRIITISRSNSLAIEEIVSDLETDEDKEENSTGN